METIKVFALGKFGVKVGFNPDVWYGFSDGVLPGFFVKGKSYSVDTKEGPRGKVITALASAPTADVPAQEGPSGVKAQATANVKSDDDKMTKADWDARDRRISRQGAIQAAVKAVSTLVPNTDELRNEAEKLAEWILTWVNK